MKLLLVQSDQLSYNTALFRGTRPGNAAVLLIEDFGELTEVLFHNQRIVLVLSAMRHFAEELRASGYLVEYFRLCRKPAKAIRSVAKKYDADRLTLMRSASFGVDETWARYVKEAGAQPAFVANDMFISTRLEGDYSVAPEKAVRMEPFYRKMRKATGILIKDGKPVGGRWNFDQENRRPAITSMTFPSIPAYSPDGLTSEAINDVETHFPSHIGATRPFRWPVTREQARTFWDDFLRQRFAGFGPYQDAMVDGQDSLYHSLISACLNIGLLDPETVCREAERYCQDEHVPLNSAEGFIRQVLGWREFVYQLYWANMPGYDESNYLNATAPLPTLYWDGMTRMRCLAEAVRPVIERGLSHHIQRLMITGNFALLAGVNPREVNRWYWLAFVDAWHWVVTPNVIGMALFADGGMMASKPYAASANYISRMSTYCKSCPYNPLKVVGADACPFNALYWDFLARNKERLSKNPRMSLAYRNLEVKPKAVLDSIRRRATSLREALANGAGAYRAPSRRAERNGHALSTNVEYRKAAACSACWWRYKRRKMRVHTGKRRDSAVNDAEEHAASRLG